MRTYKDVDKDFLIENYVNTDRSVEDIRTLLDCSQKTVVRALKYHGLSVKGRVSENVFLRDKEWLKDQYVVQKKSLRQIAKEICSTVGNVRSAVMYSGISTRGIKQAMMNRYTKKRMGSDAANWKGGIRRAGVKGRYISIYSPEHPFSTQEGYVMEHRLVVEKSIGRHLNPEEVVHHLNGISDDNRLENLELLPSRKAHTKAHFDAVKLVDDIKIENANLKKLLEENNIKY